MKTSAVILSIFCALFFAGSLVAQVQTGQYYYIQARHSGKVLDVYGASVSDAAPIIQWDNHGGLNQQFKFSPVGDGYYRIINRNSGKGLDITGGVGATGNLVKLQQYTAVGGANQMFKLVSMGDGYYRIIAKHSGKALDVTGGVQATGNGVPIIQYTAVGGYNQYFRLIPVPNSYSDAYASGAEIRQWFERLPANAKQEFAKVGITANNVEQEFSKASIEVQRQLIAAGVPSDQQIAAFAQKTATDVANGLSNAAKDTEDFFKGLFGIKN